jgi:hypothetical protein
MMTIGAPESLLVDPLPTHRPEINVRLRASVGSMPCEGEKSDECARGQAASYQNEMHGASWPISPRGYSSIRELELDLPADDIFSVLVSGLGRSTISSTALSLSSAAS